MKWIKISAKRLAANRLITQFMEIKLLVDTSIPMINGTRNLRSGICFHKFNFS
jgi:hypothetical protein